MTDLIEVRVSNLSGEALGWAVGTAEGLDVYLEPPGYNGVPWRVFARYQGQAIEHAKRYNPWFDWAIGGPLIEANNVSIHCPQHDGDCWAAWVTKDGKDVAHGGVVLPAACRAIVAATLGDTVQVPKELMP